MKIARFLKVFRLRAESAADREWRQREEEAARLLSSYNRQTMVGYAPRQQLADKCPTVIGSMYWSPK